jgi:hypothetical protein
MPSDPFVHFLPLVIFVQASVPDQPLKPLGMRCRHGRFTVTIVC